MSLLRFQLLLLSLLLVCLPAGLQAQVAPARPLNILLLSSYSQNYPSSEDLQDGLDDVLHYRRGANHFFVEYFDTVRIPDEQAGRHFAEHLQAKYENVHFDYVLVWHLSAIGFMQQHPGLFPGSRLVSFEGPRVLEDAGSQSNWFNVVQDFDSALGEVQRVYHPRKLFVVMDMNDVNSHTRRDNFEHARALQMPQVDVEYLVDRPLTEVAAILKQPQPPGTGAVYLLTFTGPNGQPTQPQEAFTWLAGQSAVPLFSFWQTLLGHGVVGGNLFSHRQAGRSLGRFLLDPASVDTSVPLDTTLVAYDWAMMEKWGLDTSLIPPTAQVINRPVSVLYTYRYHVMAVGLVVLLLSVLSLYLARAVHSRNQAVAALKAEREGLEHTVTERTRALADANDVLNHRNAELQKSLGEVKTLKGFIPFCSYCKNIRHDQGYWQKVDSYISSQTDAQISHSICPDCMKSHFPELECASPAKPAGDAAV